MTATIIGAISTTRQSRATLSSTAAGSRPTYRRESSHASAERKSASAVRGTIFRRAGKKESAARSVRGKRNNLRSGWPADSSATPGQRSRRALSSNRSLEKLQAPLRVPRSMRFFPASLPAAAGQGLAAPSADRKILPLCFTACGPKGPHSCGHE